MEPRRGLGIVYWRLWSAASLSSLADGILKFALPLVAVGLTRSPALIAGLAFAFTVPWLLFALPAGALADRLDRRRLMLTANCVRAALLAGLLLATVTGWGSIWALYVVAFSVGTAETVYDTSAQSIVPQVVGPDQLSRANGRMYGAELTANEFVGPPLAGFLVAVGAALAFSVPLGLWAVAITALLLVRGRFRVERPPSTLRADIAEGLRFLWRNRLLRTFSVMVGVFNFATQATFSILVLYAVGPGSVMGMSAQAFGFLMTTIAAGSLIGSFAAEWIERRFGRAKTLALSLVVNAALVGIPAVTANPYVIGVCFFLGGVALIVSNVAMVSLRQRITPARLLGRVNSGHRLAAWGTRPLGAVAGGVLAQFLGLRAVFALMALLVLALLLAMRVVTERTIAAAEADAGLVSVPGG